MEEEREEGEEKEEMRREEGEKIGESEGRIPD